MQDRVYVAHRSKTGVERLVFTLARLLLMATLALATYLEIRLSAH